MILLLSSFLSSQLTSGLLRALVSNPSCCVVGQGVGRILGFSMGICSGKSTGNHASSGEFWRYLADFPQVFLSTRCPFAKNKNTAKKQGMVTRDEILQTPLRRKSWSPQHPSAPVLSPRVQPSAPQRALGCVWSTCQWRWIQMNRGCLGILRMDFIDSMYIYVYIHHIQILILLMDSKESNSGWISCQVSLKFSTWGEIPGCSGFQAKWIWVKMGNLLKDG